MEHEPTSLSNSDLSVYQAYQRAPYLSVKHSSYFQVYETLLAKYVGKSITFVEVGVLNGGSLFMWRDFLGPKARVIGVELNPLAERWKEQGFEIYLGDQSQPNFWRGFFETVGKVDVLLDDGGHTNEQQIVTLVEAIPFINDGGLLLVEDVHTSYFREFGNPSRFSFVNFSKRLVDSVNSRFPTVTVAKDDFSRRIFSIGFYESIVAFHVDSRRCYESLPTSNLGQSLNAFDHARADSVQGTVARLRGALAQRFAPLKRIPVLHRCAAALFGGVHWLLAKRRNLSLRKYFSA